VSLLIITGISLVVYRHTHDHQPWNPGARSSIWSVETHIEFDAGDDPVKVTLHLPDNQPGYTVLEQSTASPGYGLSYLETGEGGSTAEWTKRDAAGRQSLYYKVRIAESPGINPEPPEFVPALREVRWSEPYKTASENLIGEVSALSADNESFTRELLKRFSPDQSDTQNIKLLMKDMPEEELLVRLLNQAGIPSMVVNGIYLEDGRRKQSPVKVLKVYDEEGRGIYYDLAARTQGLPENFILWNEFSSSVLDLEGGSSSSLSFSMIRSSEPVVRTLRDFTEEPSLLSFSIYSLPLEEQSVFKVILLIPLGVFIVVLMRILVGLRTSGTFMPVLLAMAFMETSLLTGLIGFLLVVGTGLIIRSYLSHLNLLLVARISAVIITVITIISVFTIASYKMGLTEGLKITYFPIIILSWTIERMSILWEEEGPKEVVIQGGSSLLVAVLVFLVINSVFLRYMVFNFLGLQLVLLGLILLLGNYTGYRLSELRRFSPLAGGDNS